MNLVNPLNKSTMKVSVITVCYNSEKTIEGTILSVLNQTYENLEYIIIDGGSTDNTRAIINKYKDKISIFISKADSGIYEAINKGLSVSTEKIISILHANDIFFNQNTISTVVNYFSEDNIFEVLLGDTFFKENFLNDKVNRHYSARWFKPWMLKFGISPPHLSTFLTKQTYVNTGFYKTTYKIAGDFEFFIRLFLKNNIKFKIVNDCFVIMSPGGLSGKSLRSYFTSTKEIIKACRENKIYTNILFVLFRFPLKLTQYLSKYI